LVTMPTRTDWSYDPKTHSPSCVEQLFSRNVERFRGGLVLKAHRLLYHSTLGPRVRKKMRSPSCAAPRALSTGESVAFCTGVPNTPALKVCCGANLVNAHRLVVRPEDAQSQSQERAVEIWCSGCVQGLLGMKVTHRPWTLRWVYA